MDDIVYRDRTTDALKAALSAFEFGARRTGRTERMLKLVKPGYRIICAHEGEARDVRQRLFKRGLHNSVTVIVGNPLTGHPLGHHCAFLHDRQPTLFTHEWYRAYHEHELGLVERRLRELEQLVQGPRHEPEALRMAG